MQTTEALILRPERRHGRTPPRLFFVASLPDPHPDPGALQTLIAYLDHPGSSHGRALMASNVRGLQVETRAFSAVSLLVTAIAIDPNASWRDSLREAKRALVATHPDLEELAGASILATGTRAFGPQALKLLVDTLNLEEGTWVYLPPSQPSDATHTPTLDDAARRRYVAASVELACPAPGDARAAEPRLVAKLDIDGQAWRELVRIVAGDRDTLTALTREAEDRCGELEQLRKTVSLAVFRKVYTAHRCQISGTPDSDDAWGAKRALMQSVALDTALYTPILEMGVGDLLREKIMREVNSSCGPPTDPERVE